MPPFIVENEDHAKASSSTFIVKHNKTINSKLIIIAGLIIITGLFLLWLFWEEKPVQIVEPVSTTFKIRSNQSPTQAVPHYNRTVYNQLDGRKAALSKEERPLPPPEQMIAPHVEDRGLQSSLNASQKFQDVIERQHVYPETSQEFSQEPEARVEGGVDAQREEDALETSQPHLKDPLLVTDPLPLEEGPKLPLQRVFNNNETSRPIKTQAVRTVKPYKKEIFTQEEVHAPQKPRPVPQISLAPQRKPAAPQKVAKNSNNNYDYYTQSPNNVNAHISGQRSKLGRRQVVKPEVKPEVKQTQPKAKMQPIVNNNVPYASTPELYRVQVLSSATSEKANHEAQRLKQTYPHIFRNVKAKIIKTKVGQGIRYRLQFGPFASKEQANKFITRLQSAGISGILAPES